MRGVCQQRHFPSVARPFRILWAPWAPAVFFFGLSFVLAGLGAAIFGGSAGPIVLVIGIMGGQQIASVGKRIQTEIQYLQFPIAAANADIHAEALEFVRNCPI